MKILILGGTVFIGRHLVEAALHKGHEVSLFNRGHTDKTLFPDVENLRGDRHQNLQALMGRQWDAVIDTSGYLPSAVRASAEVLQSVETYVFISSGSVYQDLDSAYLNESSSVQKISDEDLTEAEKTRTVESPTAAAYGEHYGALKARCEEVLEEILPGRVLIIRPGLVVGPYDYSNRFPYWLQRVAKGGECLAPGRPDVSISVIDARDLAAWTIAMAEKRQTGTYNATGKQSGLTFGTFLHSCKTVTESDAAFTWVDADFLLERGVQPWLELPLWLPKEFQGLMLIDDKEAVAKGLIYRPIETTCADTFSWLKSQAPSFKLEAGLEGEKERSVLQAWRKASTSA